MAKTISDSELELMKIIWAEGGSALYAVIMEKLEQTGNSWQKNTVITLLSRLVEKEMLKVNKIGRRNEYMAIVSEEGYQASQTRHFVDKIFEGNTKGLVSTLIQKEMLSPEDCEELRKYWESVGGGK